MTVSELIVFNSTILPGEGTVLEHLQHININREVTGSLNLVFTNEVVECIVVDEIVSAEVEDVMIIGIVDDSDVAIVDANMAVIVNK